MGCHRHKCRISSRISMNATFGAWPLIIRKLTTKGAYAAIIGPSILTAKMLTECCSEDEDMTLQGDDYNDTYDVSTQYAKALQR